jgi:phosphoribosylanthranilate isomerase
MSRVRIKICGIRDRAGLEAAVEAGADAVGLVLAESPRQVSPAWAADLLRHLPPMVQGIAVMREPVPALLEVLFERARPAYLQADAKSLEAFKLPIGCRRLPVYRNCEPSMYPDVMVFEGDRSGAGEQADWGLAHAVATRTRVILAGGLHAGNVAQAILQVRPYAVDVSSGVESAPGIKDRAKIMEFVAAVRAAEQEMG